MQDRVAEPIRLLLVDDDPEFLAVATVHLERTEEISVVTEQRASDGLEVVETGTVDCVASDYWMPGMDGLEFLEAVREIDPDVPFILFTGQGSESIASDAIRAGVDDYVQKNTTSDPFGTLVNRVRNAVEGARAERGYREIFEKTSIGMTVHDPETGEFLDANLRICDMLGYTREELLDLGIPTITADENPHDPERAEELIATATESGGTTFEWVVRTSDGASRWVEVSLQPATIGGRERVLAAVRDVTERKERERKTDRLQGLTRELMTAETLEAIARITAGAGTELLSLPHCGVYFPDDGGTTLVGTAITDETGSFSQLTAFVAGDDATPLDDLVWQVYAAAEPRIVTGDEADPYEGIGMLVACPLGVHGVFVAASPSGGVDLDRSILSILTANATAALDRADREGVLREREAELARQNDRLEEFASIVSHDLRDPLEAAYGHLELAAIDCESTHHEGLREMLARMEEIIEDALTLARHGQTVVEPQEVDLGEVIDLAWDTAGTADGTLSTTGELGTLLGDRSRTSQLLENLFRNSFDHGGRDVTVTVGRFDGGFYVQDDGSGIDRDDRERVFEAGYSTGADGAGLGLAIVDQIAEAHGWEVSVSESPDGGARFEITGVEWV